jgi:hypothetical protein
MNRPAIPTVNDRRAFTFTEIINSAREISAASMDWRSHG